MEITFSRPDSGFLLNPAPPPEARQMDGLDKLCLWSRVHTCLGLFSKIIWCVWCVNLFRIFLRKNENVQYKFTFTSFNSISAIFFVSTFLWAQCGCITQAFCDGFAFATVETIPTLNRAFDGSLQSNLGLTEYHSCNPMWTFKTFSKLLQLRNKCKGV